MTPNRQCCTTGENHQVQQQDYNAYIAPNMAVLSTDEGRLRGLRFALKDVIEVAGYVNAAGNPDWLRTHKEAACHAEIVSQLLAAGASLHGMTHTDELMYSLNGENMHYGTPVNPAAPDRIPGGSSSGSAVAAATGDVDFAIGTDTGGSVRIPSSYCGIYGFRPTHGAVSMQGVIPLARSFDTVGWMSMRLKYLVEVGETLLPQQDGLTPVFTQFYMDDEAWEVPEYGDRQKFLKCISELEGELLTSMTSVQLAAQVWEKWQEQAVTELPERYAGLGQGLPLWAQAFRLIQGHEIWQEHGAWVEREKPSFGPGIADRMSWTSTLSEADVAWAKELREVLRSTIGELLGERGLLMLPTAPGVAPYLGLDGEKADAYRAKVMQLSCIAGLAGLPQLTIPVWREDGMPMGLSFIAGPGKDLALLHWIDEWCRVDA